MLLYHKDTDSRIEVSVEEAENQYLVEGTGWAKVEEKKPAVKRRKRKTKKAE